MKSIVVIEDNEDMQLLLLDNLSSKFDVPIKIYASIKEFFAAKYEENSVYLIDWYLQDGKGDIIIEHIRKRDKLGPIFLMSAEDNHDNILRGLKLGADDFLVKPFTFEVLCLKIERCLEKKKHILAQNDQSLVLIPEASLVIQNEKKIKLTDREFQIFTGLYQNLNKVTTREELLKDSLERTADFYVFNLRKKIEPLTLRIECVRSHGYRMVDASQE